MIRYLDGDQLQSPMLPKEPLWLSQKRKYDHRVNQQERWVCLLLPVGQRQLLQLLLGRPQAYRKAHRGCPHTR